MENILCKCETHYRCHGHNHKCICNLECQGFRERLCEVSKYFRILLVTLSEKERRDHCKIHGDLKIKE